MSERVLDILQGDAPSKVGLRQHLDYGQDWHCLIWPFSRTQPGYGQITSDHHAVHRLVCEYRHGPAPSDAHQASHSCNRGHDGCVNPMHLSWKTISENVKDRFRGKPLGSSYKVTPEQVDQIRALKGRERTVDTAARFQINERTVRQIQNGETWKKDRRDQRQFTAEEVGVIRSTSWKAKTADDFAQEFGVSRSTIERIRQGRTYRYYDSDVGPPANDRRG